MLAACSSVSPPTATQDVPNKKAQFVDSIKKAAFIIGTALCVFAAARNSITWHLQNFWGASGDFWQSHWEKIHDFFGGNNFLLCVVGSNIVTFGIFWFFSFFFLLLDITGKPAFLLRYKVQQDINTPVDPVKLKNAVRDVLFNQICIGIPFTLLVYPLTQWRGCSSGRELPTFHWVLFDLLIFSLVEECGFYYSHRMFHLPMFYKNIHKKHHEWTAPIGIVSIYAHPVEHLISNLIPPFLGPLLMGSHLATAWMWYSLALVSTIIAHSGYHFPLLPSPEAHDFHHLKFTQNFGVLGVLDRLHGTDNIFRASSAYQRHILLLSLTPISQSIPDKCKKKTEK